MFGNFGFGFGINRGKYIAFNPLNINGLSLYLNKKNATVSSWLDQSPNAYDFVQATGTKQPVISTNSVDFDGTDDSLDKVVSQALNDSSGILFFSGYNQTGDANLISSANNAVTNQFFRIYMYSTGVIAIDHNNLGTRDLISTTTTYPIGTYLYGYVKSNGTSYEMSVNDNIETISILAGANSGDWFDTVLLRDNLVIGSLQTSVPSYTKTQLNKLIYSNDYTIDTEPILTFMSNPAN